jgi:hypothetical protein
MHGTWRRGLLRITPILAIGLLGILVAAPSAAGQAAVDQYVPRGNPAGGPHGGGTLDNPYGTSPSAIAQHKLTSGTESGSDSGGRLPITDYPGTPFVWIVIAILVAGALIRLGIEVKKRRGALGTS